MRARRADTAGHAPSQRQLRAGEQIRHALVDILAREEFRDPALQGVSVTIGEVRCSPDLKHAAVFCAPLGGGDTQAVAEGLNRASAFIRGRLGRMIDMKFTLYDGSQHTVDSNEMKFTPNLRDIADESYASASEMDALLRRPEIARDLEEE